MHSKRVHSRGIFFKNSKLLIRGRNMDQNRKIQIYSEPSDTISPFWKEKYDREAKKYWDIFYKRHENRFFKDRHYLDKEWGNYFNAALSEESSDSQDRPGKKVLLEVGCGVGNTIFPLLSTFPNAFIHACDFSSRAIQLVKAHNDYSEDRVHAFVCDVTADDLSTEILPASIDIVTLIFVLSAVSPDKMPQVLNNIKRILKPSGYLLLRDYATGDLAQERLVSKEQKISENFYVRGDGTRVFYFSGQSLKSLFEKCGFINESIDIHCKKVENRSRGLIMDRRWIQAAFKLPASDSVTQNTPTNTTATRDSYRDDIVLFCNTKNEKDNDSTEPDLCGSIGVEFLGDICDANEVHEIVIESNVFKLKCLSKEYQHTCKSTGLMLWESAQLLAPVLAANPELYAGKTILELGCGSSGLCSMVAAKASNLVVATDGDEAVLELLNENISLNSHLFNKDRLLAHKLEWGNKDHIKCVQSINKEGFDLVIGTDVMYVQSNVIPLFETARALVSSSDQGSSLILCHVIRRVDEEYILSIADQFGFHLVDKWPSDRKESALEGSITSWFWTESNKVLFLQTALRIMYFKI